MKARVLGSAILFVAATGMVGMVGIGAASAQSSELATSAAASQESLSPQLEPLRPYLGKTWRSVPPAGDDRTAAARPVVDVSKWERALNGTAVRVLHSINDGVYGGESIIFWDEQKQSLVYYYFTTAGHYTQGTLTYKDGVFTGDEAVTGDSEGVTQVRSTTQILPDGRMHTKAEYLQKGAWSAGHEFYYVEDPAAKVVFK
jgi:hypothetical protein